MSEATPLLQPQQNLAGVQNVDAARTAIQNILTFFITSISVFSLGHINTESLAAISLASLLVNTSGTCVAQGVASALDTLCSQSFTGSSDHYAIGKHLQRGLVVGLVLTFPIALMWWFAEPLLLSLGQDPEISRISGLFIRWMIPGLFPLFANECLRKYLFAQGIMKPAMYVTILSALLSVFLQWLLVWSPISIGAVGAPISTSIVNIFTPLATVVYIYFVEGGDHFVWDMAEAFDFTKIMDIIYLGTPGTFMVVSEWLCFEAAALAAGMIGTDSLAAQTIVINTGSFLWQIPFGLAIATTTRIGNSLGANQPETAKNVAMTALLFSLVPAAINMTILLLCRHNWGYIFSDQPSVVKLVADILPLAAFYQLSDTTGCIGGAAIRGCGLQKLGSAINITGYYVIGVPLGILLTFHYDMGLFGIWVGLTVGLCFVATVQVLILFRMDWHEQSRAAQKRVGSYDPISTYSDLSSHSSTQSMP
ncbi:hypothetical protein HDU91_007278 [Kappamyces sp. JEL0680]|nr:hypothetical protein HDU91_007278 [Kappamyces sp. JEL0680]